MPVVGRTSSTARILKNSQAYSRWGKDVPFPFSKKESTTPILWKYRAFLTRGMFIKTHKRSNFTRVIVSRNYFEERGSTQKQNALYTVCTSRSLCLRMFRPAIDRRAPPRVLFASWSAVASFRPSFIPLNGISWLSSVRTSAALPSRSPSAASS